MDVHAKLDEIVAAVEGARAMPMSASCIVNRGELLAALDELRELMPGELRAAEDVLRDRAGVLDDGRREAERVIAEAHAERSRLLSETALVQAAQEEAEDVRAQAAADADRMRAEVEDYVDTKLANFEVALQKTLRTVERGRARLRDRAVVVDEELPELPELAGPAD